MLIAPGDRYRKPKKNKRKKRETDMLLDDLEVPASPYTPSLAIPYMATRLVVLLDCGVGGEGVDLCWRGRGQNRRILSHQDCNVDLAILFPNEISEHYGRLYWWLARKRPTCS